MTSQQLSVTFHVSKLYMLVVVLLFSFLKQYGKRKHFPERLTQIKDDAARVSLPLFTYNLLL